MSTTKKNEKAPKAVAPKSTPPERAHSLQQRVEAEREVAIAELGKPIVAAPAVIIPPAPPLTETERLNKRVAELESELLQIQRNASVDFTRLAKVLRGS
jgi:hypothetical protein